MVRVASIGDWGRSKEVHACSRMMESTRGALGEERRCRRRYWLWLGKKEVAPLSGGRISKSIEGKLQEGAPGRWLAQWK